VSRAITPTVLAIAAGLSLAACGSGEESESTAQKSTTTQRQVSKDQQSDAQSAAAKPDRSRQKAEAKADQGAPPSDDPRVQALQAQFPPPKPAPGAKQLSAEAIEAGQQACQGKSPQQVKDEFYALAEAHLDSAQRELIDELPRYEAEAAKDPSFVAGQLAATVYSATLDEAERSYGLQGCVFALAQGLVEEIAGSRE
jgi:hypothetical protein